MKRLSSACILALAFALLVPARASADYLYSLWKDNERTKPAVMVILDTSGSMDATDSCAYGRKNWLQCYQRIDAAQQVLERTLPRIAAEVDLGLITFRHKNDGGTPPPSNRSQHKTNTDAYKYCGVTTEAKPPADYEDLIDKVLETEAETNTPLEWSLDRAHNEIKELRAAEGESCRDYYVILLTDGEDTCAKNGHADVLKQVKAMYADGVRTFIIGFGKDLTDTDGKSNMSQYARAGGTATNDKGEFVCWDDATCGGNSKARAMFAYDTDQLDDALLRSFEVVRRGIFSAAEPIVATVPTRDTEIERVARNLMVYSAFEMQGDNLKGHLYGIRLFEETAPYSGVWEFTDMDAADLLTKCGPGETCLFDAGAMLAERVKADDGKARRIFTAQPGVPDRTNGGYVVPMTGVIELPQTDGGAEALKDAWADFSSTDEMKLALTDAQLPQKMPAQLTKANLREPTSSQLRTTIDWLHGDIRAWPLGDMYHGSAVVVEPPAFNFIDRGYPQYKQYRSTRPWMIYGGANDGMIHAFYASPDFDWKRAGASGPRWQPGDEAWAYLPNNLIARTVFEVARGAQRFFSMDLSCRYADIVMDDPVKKVGGEEVVDCGEDEDCGWATILLCGQGWGGSWYVALDVSDPENPMPLWEGTIPGPEGAKASKDAYGIGRTWSVPSIALVNMDGKPNWLAIFGNGYNADMANCPAWKSSSTKCENAGGVTYKRHASYRMLNLPFDGQYPEHGDGTDGDNGHAWVMNLADGEILQSFHVHKDLGKANSGDSTTPEGKQATAGDPGALIADVASIDTDNNAFMDAAYLGGFDGSLYRIYFGDKKTAGKSAIGMCAKDILHFGTSKRITSNPAVVRNPGVADGVYLFLGTGVDGGKDPDQQRNNGNQWEFGAFAFADDGSSDCDGVKGNTGLCKNSDWKLGDRARLLGQPVFSRQADGRDWLLYTTWTPPAQNTCSASGVARLWCLDISNTADCDACGSLGGDDEPERSVVIDTDGVPPTSPVVADGNVYVGPKRHAITNGEDDGPRPNSRKSRVVTISWREVF